MRVSELLFEMANLNPAETGLPFHVFVSPKGGAKHEVGVKVTPGGWSTLPEGHYGLRPSLHHVEGEDWLSADQKRRLGEWATLNMDALLALWDGRIHDDHDLRARLKGLGDAPPGNSQQAVGALRSSAPKLRAIYWGSGAYHLHFDSFAPDHKKIERRFGALGFREPLVLTTGADNSGILLWKSD